MNRKNLLRSLKSLLRKNKRHLPLAGICLLLLACNTPFYEQYQSIGQSNWAKDKEYYFIVEVTDTISSYQLSVKIRNNNRYPFQNLWLLGSITFPDSTVHRDTTECLLADDYGKWFGKGISVFESGHPLVTPMVFPRSGKYTFGFRQGMRKDELYGIQEIGLRIEKAAQ